MDQDRLDHIARGLASGRSRRGLLGAGAAMVALLVAQPVAAGKAAKPKGQPKGQPKNPGNSQPGTGQNGQPGSGQLGSPGPSCGAQCEEVFDECLLTGPDPDYCETAFTACLEGCSLE